MEGFDGLVVPVVACDGGTVVGGGAAAMVVVRVVKSGRDHQGGRRNWEWKMEFGGGCVRRSVNDGGWWLRWLPEAVRRWPEMTRQRLAAALLQGKQEEKSFG